MSAGTKGSRYLCLGMAPCVWVCLQPLGQGMFGNGMTQAIDAGYRCIPELYL